MNMQDKLGTDNDFFVVSAAGGNATAMRIVLNYLAREEYSAHGRMMEKSPLASEAEVEQSGFVVLNDRHLEMSGSEFCGNATRAAAVLLSKAIGEAQFEMTVSGYTGPVQAKVTPEVGDNFVVEVVFGNMPLSAIPANIDRDAVVVDLGGIVHVLVNEQFPGEEAAKIVHREVTEKLGLRTRPAVGVVWVTATEKGMRIDPVVWVRDQDTFYYEKACGSASIAVGFNYRATRVTQPSNQDIEVRVDGNEVTLSSHMEVVHVPSS